MAELLDVLDAFSTPLKIGWVVWIAWGIGQVYWYRQEREPGSRSRSVVAATSRPAPSRRAMPEPTLPAAAPLVPRPTVHEPVVEPPAPGATDALPFDPSSATVETFASTPTDLDRFVADFERRSSQSSHDRPHAPDQPGHLSPVGAEAPQSS